MGKPVSVGVPCLTTVLFLSAFVSLSPVAAETEESAWEEPAPIDVPSGGDVSGPDIAMSADGTAMAVWLQAESEGCLITDLSRGRCQGLVWANRYVPPSGWESPVLIGELGPSDVYVALPRVAMDTNGRAVAVWANDTLWANHFMPGIGWATPRASPWDPSFSLRVLFDSRGVAVMVWSEWEQRTVWAGHYDPGQGWGEPTLLASNATRPQIASDEAGNVIVAVWPQGESRSIGASRFTPESGWGDPTVYQLPEGEVHPSVDVGVASDGTAVVTWGVVREGDARTFEFFDLRVDGDLNLSVWAASLAADMTWSKGFELETQHQAPVGLVVDGRGTATVLYTYWGCGYGGFHAFWAARFVPGSGWEEPSLITDAGVCYGVHLVGYAAGHATVVWGAGTSAVWGVQYAPDRGWGTPTRISEEGVNTWDPWIAANPRGDVIVGWMQWTGGGGWWEHKKRIYATDFHSPPLLALTSPQDGSTTSAPTVAVVGQTSAGATLVVNGIQAAVASDGSFSFLLALEEGTNTITAVATDARSLARTLSVQVTYVNPLYSLEGTLEETNDALADAELDLQETNDALADARSGLALASQNLFLTFVLQLALAASVAVLFVLYLQQRRDGPGTILGFSMNRKAATSSAPGRGSKLPSIAADRTHRLASQPEERPWPKTPAGSPLHLTIKERIALHLLDHTRHAEAEVVPPELSQEGIAEAAGFNRRHFAQNVRPLVDEGLMEERMAHVEGALQRQKVYSLTYEGWKRTLGVRNRIISVIVPVHDNREDGKASIEEILGNAHGSKSLLDVVRESAERESWKPNKGD